MKLALFFLLFVTAMCPHLLAGILPKAQAEAALTTPTIAAQPAVFKMTLSQKPENPLNPQQLKATSSSFLYYNLYRSLLKINSNNQLEPDLAEKCGFKTPVIFYCQLPKKLKWSDGSSLTAANFLQNYQKLLTSENQFLKADLLFSIKNAEDFYKGRIKDFKQVGIKALSAYELQFILQQPDPDFEYALAQWNLSPWQENKFTGPYRVITHSDEKIILEKNPFYLSRNTLKKPASLQKNSRSIQVEFQYITSDSTVVQLFEKKQIHMVRRLPTSFIPKYKNQPEFHFIPMLRMDYIGLNYKIPASTRKLLATRLNYLELQKILWSPGQPGCLGLPKGLFISFPEECHAYQPHVATTLNKTELSGLNLRLIYSASGGDDHRRVMEWLQNQWQKNLNILIPIQSYENSIFQEELKKNNITLFRKGFPMEYPTCRSIIRTLQNHPQEHPLGLASANISSNLDKVSKKACTDFLKQMMTSFQWIPLGPIHFAYLIDSSWTGWTINGLNQMDLTELSVKL